MDFVICHIDYVYFTCEFKSGPLEPNIWQLKELSKFCCYLAYINSRLHDLFFENDFRNFYVICDKDFTVDFINFVLRHIHIF